MSQAAASEHALPPLSPRSANATVSSSRVLGSPKEPRRDTVGAGTAPLLADKMGSDAVRRGRRQRGQRCAATPRRLIWRTACQAGSVHGVFLAGWAGRWWEGVVAAGGAVRASTGFATVVSLMCGGWVTPRPWFRRIVRCLKSSAAAGAGAHRRPADGCARCREARAASPAATGCRSLGCQREVLILLALLCFCGTGVACVRGSPAGVDAGGTRSGWVSQVAISQQ